MDNEIILNDTSIQVSDYKLEKIDGKYKLSTTFNVTSEEYHDIAVLLYEMTFDIKVPEKEVQFKGSIIKYSTSFTNLYEKNRVAEYKLTLLEDRE